MHIMKFTELLKAEVAAWKSYEIFGLFIVACLIVYNILFLNDSVVAVLSSICGILYTILAGKGKVYCYFFGLSGSGFYVLLALSSALWGNAFLYLLYYIPMQIIGIFKWKKNLKTNSLEIHKTELPFIKRVCFFAIGVIGSALTIFILNCLDDKSPVIDGITTFLSVLGMYFTIKRLIEQWIIWIIVNGLSFIMWLILVLNGTRAYSALVMWGVYFILAIYFYLIWEKEIKNNIDNSLN